MKTRRLRKLVGALSLGGAAAVVVRGVATDHVIEQLIRLPNMSRLPIILLPAGTSLEAADEERMRLAGWVRA